ncbi:MAG TPA: adenylate/guanylate cyclase domain-containing protein [Candidatus Limnocylindrales bacterium]|nr:adenylate/guanylate cyclase domain-containing protein [Candidatus Limnocylindrales bacterium]
MTSLRRLLDSVLARLADIGAVPGDDEETRLQKGLLVLIALLILPIAGIWAVLYLAFGAWTGYLAVVYAVVSLTSIVVYTRNHDFELLLNVQLLAIAVTPTVSMIPIGGLLPTGGVGLWGIMAPLGALVFRGVGSGIRWFVFWLVMFLGSGLVAVLIGSQSPMPEWFSSLMLALNIAVGGTIVFTLLALFAKQRQDALLGLREAQERAENLLLSILPASIAERLKSSPQTIADQFTDTSVLFADVVEFTPRSNGLSAAEVVGLLDRLFGEFDMLAERYGLEKIKTIGDAYMVAAGVPEPRLDHARCLALLALDMLAATRPDGAVGDLDLTLRIGINSGPVVAGVIGRKRFLYDLWGDTVNTASRMESQGSAGQIQITRATYELLKDEFVCEFQGAVPVKGKGEMETWFVMGKLAGEEGFELQSATA